MHPLFARTREAFVHEASLSETKPPLREGRGREGRGRERGEGRGERGEGRGEREREGRGERGKRGGSNGFHNITYFKTVNPNWCLVSIN